MPTENAFEERPSLHFMKQQKRKTKRKKKMFSMTKAFEGSIALRFDRKKINSNKTKRKREKKTKTAR